MRVNACVETDLWWDQQQDSVHDHLRKGCSDEEIVAVRKITR